MSFSWVSTSRRNDNKCWVLVFISKHSRIRAWPHDFLYIINIDFNDINTESSQYFWRGVLVLSLCNLLHGKSSSISTISYFDANLILIYFLPTLISIGINQPLPSQEESNPSFHSTQKKSTLHSTLDPHQFILLVVDIDIDAIYWTPKANKLKWAIVATNRGEHIK